MTLVLDFGWSASPVYVLAVDLAGRLPGYGEEGTGRRRRHACAVRLSPETIRPILGLWDLVGTWRSTRLAVDGRPLVGRERWAWLQAARCAGLAALTEAPGRYCRTAPPGAPPIPPHVPCRHLGARWGARLEQITPDQLAAILLESGVAWCPFWLPQAAAVVPDVSVEEAIRRMGSP